jgi:hypothetical protein
MTHIGHRLLRAGILIPALALGGIALGTSPADAGTEAAAASARVYEGDDYASSNGRWVEVCDIERDGNGVYGEFRTNTGWTTVRDGNGSNGGCGNATFGSVNLFRICEDRSYRPDPCSSYASP